MASIQPQPPAERALDAPFSPDELARFKSRVAPLAGVDLEAYRPRQMERRITALFYRASAKSLEELYGQLQASPERLEAFIDGLTINVSEFARDPDHFATLGTRILPELLAAFPALRVWSAGCAAGCELYTVGMWLEQLGALARSELIGTDLDRGVLARARSAHTVYAPHEVQAIQPAWRASHFEADGPGLRFTGPAIRARARFETHNLLSDPPIAPVQLILCRNVVIYLNDASKQQLFRDFATALSPGGVLFVGSTEQIFAHRELGLEPIAPCFYRKRVGRGT